MADVNPIKARYDGATPIGLQELEAADTIGIIDGGTSASTATDAFNNLAPLTAKGDLIVGDSGGDAVILSVDANDGKILLVDSGEASGLGYGDINDITGTLSVLNGGTGATNRTDALNNIAPSAPSHGDIMYFDGNTSNWVSGGLDGGSA